MRHEELTKNLNTLKAKATYQASAAEASECPVKHGMDPAAATAASQVTCNCVLRYPRLSRPEAKKKIFYRVPLLS